MMILETNAPTFKPSLGGETGILQSCSQNDSDWQGNLKRKPEDFSGTSQLNLRKPEELRRFARCDGDLVELVVGVDSSEVELKTLESRALEEGGKVAGAFAFGRRRVMMVMVPVESAYVFAERLRVSGSVRYVEPNMRLESLLVPNDPYWSYQWGPRRIEADVAWNTTIGSSDVLVAIVDTGVDYTHPDLAANYVPLGYDWVNSDVDPIDDFGHGTHCAGIVAASLNNSIGIAGLAQVQIMAEKVLGSDGGGYYTWVSEGIIHATDSGAKIISMSLGGPDYSELLHDAVKYAYDHGVLVVAAAGNTATEEPEYPAAYEEVIAVSATNVDDSLATFSTYGSWVDLSAPGVGVYSTMPTYHVTLNDKGFPMNYGYMSGTSMACPHVSGVAALAWSTFTNYTNNQISRLLRRTADDLGEVGFDKYFGYGQVNARKVLAGLPEHDVRIDKWEHPYRLYPDQLGTFNLTVLNYGENNESNISVEFIVNETLIESTRIDFLQVDASKTVSFLWNSTAIGTYNATCYVVPVAGENSTENDVVSSRVFVRFPITLRVPSDYPMIKEAMDNAGDGDTVIISEGYYAEGQIDILMSNFSLIADGNVTLDGCARQYGLNIRADNVQVDGFNVLNASFGIYIKGNGDTITRNNLIDVSEGIHAFKCFDCLISLNSVNRSTGNGILLEYCLNCTINQNTITSKSWWIGQVKTLNGILVTYSSNTTVTLNNLVQNRKGIQILCGQNSTISLNSMEKICDFGVRLVASSFASIDSNNITWPSYGIILDTAESINVTNNLIKTGGEDPTKIPSEVGIDLYSSNSILVSSNTLLGNRKGVFLWFTENSVISSNNVISALDHAVMITDSSNNLFFHNNFINNTGRVDFNNNCTNVWDDNYPSGGNYWSDYADADEKFGVDQGHNGCDGIGDVPLIINTNNTDRYPLMKPWASGTIHELSASGLLPSKNVVGEGYSLNITVTVTNQGDSTEIFNVTSRTGATEIHKRTIVLSNGTSIAVSFSWETTGFAKGNHTISAYADPVEGETNTTDNNAETQTVTISVAGDVTSITGIPDGKVDMRDIGAVCSSFGTTPTDSSWNVNYDINNDGTINMRDIGIVCSHFGQHYP